MDELQIAIVAGLGSMLCWGLADFFAKKTIDRLGDVTTLFWGTTIGIIPLAALFIWQPIVPDKLAEGDLAGLIFLIFLGAWSGLSYIPTYTAFGKGKVSLLSPIFASYAAVVAILSAIFLGEIIPLPRISALVIVFAGVLLISGDLKRLLDIIRGKGRRREEIAGFREIMLAVAVYSPWLITLGWFIGGEYWVPFLLGIRIFSAITLFIYTRIRKIPVRVTDGSLWKYLAVIGFFDVAAFASISWGYSASPYVSIVTMLSAAFSLPTIILAMIFLKERITRTQMVGGLIIIGGAMLLALV
jgi:drug/metabolite transporter (DMT)-like permease